MSLNRASTAPPARNPPKEVQHQRSSNLDKLNVIYQNVRGLKTKLPYFKQYITTLDNTDIIAITETYLDPSVYDAELFPLGWSILRRDRPSLGGGVLLATRPGLNIRRQVELETSSGEDLWVSFVHHGREYYVCVVYITPSAKEEDYLDWCCKVEENIASVLHKVPVIVLGDLNLNSANVYVNNYMGYFYEYCNLTERNNIFNVCGSKLDVVLVSDNVREVSVSEADDGLVEKTDRYHTPPSK